MKLQVSMPAPTYNLTGLSREQLDTILSALTVAVRVYDLPMAQTPPSCRGMFSMSKKQEAIEMQTCLRSYTPS